MDDTTINILKQLPKIIAFLLPENYQGLPFCINRGDVKRSRLHSLYFNRNNYFRSTKGWLGSLNWLNPDV